MIMTTAEFEARIRELAIAEAEHRARKAKAEADLAELTLAYARRAYPENNAHGGVS